MKESVVNKNEILQTRRGFANTSPHRHLPNHRHLSLAYTSLTSVLTFPLLSGTPEQSNLT
jgi:hypothetical protein